MAPSLTQPPGSMGLPVAGETLAFLANMYRFLDDRQKRYGDIFKSNVLGRNIVFLSGTEGSEAFYSPGNITRSDAHPFPLVNIRWRLFRKARSRPPGTGACVWTTPLS